MKVLCLRIINPVTLQVELKHPAVQIDQEYLVLSVIVQGARGAKLRIVTTDGTPALFDAAMFASVDDRIPDNWVARVGEGGVMEFAPDSWLEAGFWQRFFDRDASAISTFETEMLLMKDTNS